MLNQKALRISQDPNYQKLVRTRSVFGWLLTFIMLWVYFGFIYLVAFEKDLLAKTIGSGVITLSIPFGIGVIVFTVLITGFYVQRANKEFDALTREIHKDHK